MSVPRVLFVCVENSCRSQMAEAFARMLAGAGVEAVSAGSKPSGVVNPKAVAALAELGYDLGTHRSKSLAEIPPGPYDAAVTMGCGDACPQVEARLREDWPLPDPKHMPREEFNAVRDAVRERVAALLLALGARSGDEAAPAPRGEGSQGGPAGVGPGGPS